MVVVDLHNLTGARHFWKTFWPCAFVDARGTVHSECWRIQRSHSHKGMRDAPLFIGNGMCMIRCDQLLVQLRKNKGVMPCDKVHFLATTWPATCRWAVAWIVWSGTVAMRYSWRKMDVNACKAQSSTASIELTMEPQQSSFASYAPLRLFEGCGSFSREFLDEENGIQWFADVFCSGVKFTCTELKVHGVRFFHQLVQYVKAKCFHSTGRVCHGSVPTRTVRQGKQAMCRNCYTLCWACGLVHLTIGWCNACRTGENSFQIRKVYYFLFTAC